MKQLDSRFGAVVREWQDPGVGYTARQMVRDELAKASAHVATKRSELIARLEERGHDIAEATEAVDEALRNTYHGVRTPLTPQAADWLLREDPEVIYETFLMVLSGDAMNDLVETVYSRRGEV